MAFNKKVKCNTMRDQNFEAAARNGLLDSIISQSKASRGLVRDEILMSKALIEACMNGHMNVVQWLAENTKVDFNYRGRVQQTSVVQKQNQPFSITLLTAACYNNHLDLVKYLVEIPRANFNLLDKGGFTPLTIACHRANFSVAMFLANKLNKDEINFTNKKKQNTALHYAVWCNKQNWTPLHEACQQRDVNKVRELVYVKGYDINAQDNSGYTPLHTACYYGYSDIVKILMMAGANETITNDHTKTPAQLAEINGHTKILELLDGVSLWGALQRTNISVSIGYIMMVALHLMERRNKQTVSAIANESKN